MYICLWKPGNLETWKDKSQNVLTTVEWRTPRERLSRPLHPVLLYFSHASKRESFSPTFCAFFVLIIIVIVTSKLFNADFEIYEDDPPLSERALDGWTGQGAKSLMSPIKVAPSRGLRGSNKPVPSYCNWGRGGKICGPLGSGRPFLSFLASKVTSLVVIIKLQKQIGQSCFHTHNH